AVSLSLDQYPLLNAKVDTESDPNGKPQIIMRSKHNIGVAMDTPQGLLVPNIKNVGARSVLDITSELHRLSALAKDGKLGPLTSPAGLSQFQISVTLAVHTLVQSSYRMRLPSWASESHALSL